MMFNIGRFQAFVVAFTGLVDEVGDDEVAIFTEGKRLLMDLIDHDDWLPEQFAEPDPEGYHQYLLHCDPEERFSVVSFAWGPGQESPVHDHTVWGMVGMLRGAELCTEYTRAPSGGLVASDVHRLEPGDIDLVAPSIGDMHKIANALPDAPSISIHVYGGNIGMIERHRFDVATGQSRPFVAPYAAAADPELWDPAA
jgi:predicted metal-dependent enzyme (double-stranded beta helix superfamily)